MYSITLDPARDTPARLKEYAAGYAVKPGWRFLTGKFEDIERLRRRFGLVDPDPQVDKDRSQHIGMTWIGSDPLDRWCATPSLSRPQQIVKAITWMYPYDQRFTPVESVE